ncbi:LOW QUALITY PROTEIN: mediator of DNA damage checkpoint protein 1 [Pseudochaenichthys georgianus]|uniref:LOW QUALITY PROTEIN: mediator of DNA damage checkpoint protein 1 n=1 Tax=Pseudochaenichthys georgianus TaxID=52239 RepID=UPI0039C1D27C
MDATQRICDSILESDEEDHEDESENKRGRPLAKLCILKNAHIPETEVPLFLGENALGRDPNSCAVPLIAPSISKQHATICLSVYRKRGRHSEVDIQALVWDQGSMNGTRKGQMKLTPNVRYALSERDSLVVADIPCQYVSCAENAVSSQGDARTPVSRHSGVKATLLHATSTGGKKYVNGGTGARVSLPDQEDTMKTPGVTTVLSFEQTPTYPEESLVPESDSDSDGERGKRRRKAIVSDSDSHTSSPRCSTFLSPTNKTVPESEDESTITPSSSTKNRPRRHVSFSLEETDMDAGRQQLDNKKTVEIADDSAEEEHREEEGTAPGGTQSEESEQHVPPVKTGSNVRRTGQDPEFTPSVFTDPIPVFDMDSDTDEEEEEEEEEEGACPVTLTTNQQADQPPDTAQFHMDSDTDVDEDDEALDQVPKSVPSSAAHDTPHVIAVIQPEGVTMDSDTDVDDDAMSDAATNAKPPSLLSTQTADSAFSTQVENVHLDSDTDVDEEEEMERGTHNKYPEIDETPTRLDIRPASIPAAPDSLQLDSDTDGEAIPAPALGEPASLTESCTAAQPGADLDILSDSDADEEEDSALFIALVVLDVSVDPGTSDEADPDVGESAVPPAGDAADLKEDSDTDVEDAAESQIPRLQREIAAGLLAPLQQNCSTPVPLTEGGLEDMDTQAFFTPSAVPYRRAVAPAVRRMVLSASSGSQEDEDLVTAETQSFVLQTRGRRGTPPQDPGQAFSLESSGDEQSSREASFQFALSDSRHLQGQALAMENTQTFVGGDVSVSMEDTQAYAAVSNADGTSLESDPDLEATQSYGKEAEPAGCSVTSAKESQVDFDLKDTQDFITMPDSDSEDDTDDDDDDDDESRNTATAATQAFDVPTSSTLAMAETQLMPVFEEDESSDEDSLLSSVLQVKREEDGEADQPQKKHHSEALSVAETQPMHISEDEESDDEDLIPGPRKRKAKPPQLDEEPTQTLSNSELSLETQPMHMGVSETQPMATSEDEESDDEESDDEDSMPGPRKRKAKPLQLDEEPTQTLSNSELSLETQPMHMGVSETQPMATSGNEESDDEESDDEDSMPGPRKRKAKPLQLDEEPTQTLSNSELSAVQTQPMDGNEEGESDEGETPPLASSSDVSAVETQPAGEDEEIDDEEDSILRPRKRKAKPLQIQEEGTQPLTSSEEREDQSEREIKEKEEQERLESEKTEREEKERMEREANERVEKEEQETLKCEKERIEKEEEMERLEKERIEREEEMERLEKERIEREEEMERLERERIERERKEKEEKENLEVAKRELGERLERIEQAKLEREAKEKEEGDGLEEEEEKKSKTPARSRRATRATTAAPPRSAEAEADSISANDDVPARRTRSRSNSSNSVSSERSASSVSSLGGRGRGRGAKRGSSAPPPAASTRGTDRRRRNTVSTQQGTNDAPPPLLPPPPGSQSRSKVSSCSVSSQSRGGRGGKTEPIPAINIQSEQIVDPTPAARGRKSRRGEQLPQEVDTEKADPQQADPQQAPTTRGRRRANVSEPNAAERQDNSSQGCASGESPLPKRTVRGRAVQSETVEAPAAPAGSEGDREVGKGRKGDLEEANTEEASSSGSHKVFPGKRKAPAPEEAGGTNDETPVPAKRRGRASTAQANKVAGVSSAKVKGSEESETREEVPVKKRGRGRPSVAQRKMKEEQEESGLSVDHAEASEPQTPTSAASRKRQALADSSPVAKTPRSSSASPGGRLRSVSHAYKVLFTGVVDEEGERVLARLGGRLAKGVADMNCLVTDKVRRTVKFLCAVAKGVPIVTTHWLEKSCKAGSFLSPNAFAVEDPEQENRFSFCLQESLRIASSQPLLQGYHIHVTESVQPEPVQMKDIIFCSGATLLPKMPSSPKPQTFVISCEEDLSLCRPALSASLPVFTAEFLLTGILQQRLDHQTHRLSAPAHSLQPAGGRGRGRKKT